MFQPNFGMLETDQIRSSSANALQMFRQGEQDQIAANQRNLLKDIGQRAATGDIRGATSAAFAGGDVKTAVDLSQWDEGRRTKALGLLYEGAKRADTPAKWNALVGMVSQTFGPEMVGQFRNFDSRPNALTVLEQAELKMKQQAESRQAAAAARDAQMHTYRLQAAQDDSAISGMNLELKKREMENPAGKMVTIPKDSRAVIFNPRTNQYEEVISPSGQADAGEQYKMEKELRGEVSKVASEYNDVNNSYKTLQNLSASPSPAGDISIVFAYMKMLDPSSTVREGEQAQASNAGGIDTKVRNMYNYLLTGQRLTPEQRADFVKQAQTLYNVRETKYKADLDRYRGIASRYKLDLRNIIPEEPQGGGGGGGSPKGTGGQSKTLRAINQKGEIIESDDGGKTWRPAR